MNYLSEYQALRARQAREAEAAQKWERQLRQAPLTARLQSLRDENAAGLRDHMWSIILDYRVNGESDASLLAAIDEIARRWVKATVQQADIEIQKSR